MWNKLIEEIIGTGLTEQEIVNRLMRTGVKTTQPTINRIKKGEIPDPRYSLGSAIVNLHKIRCRRYAS